MNEIDLKKRVLTLEINSLHNSIKVNIVLSIFCIILGVLDLMSGSLFIGLLLLVGAIIGIPGITYNIKQIKNLRKEYREIT